MLLLQQYKHATLDGSSHVNHCKKLTCQAFWQRCVPSPSNAQPRGRAFPCLLCCCYRSLPCSYFHFHVSMDLCYTLHCDGEPSRVPVRRGACLTHPAKQISVSVLCQGSSAGWAFHSVKLAVADGCSSFVTPAALQDLGDYCTR